VTESEQPDDVLEGSDAEAASTSDAPHANESDADAPAAPGDSGDVTASSEPEAPVAPPEPAAEAPEADEAGEAEAPEAEQAVAPTAEAPAAEEPIAEEPIAEEPAAEEPAAEEPTAEEPTAEEPTAEEPTAEEPTAEEPVAEEPAAEQEPAAEEAPAADADVDPDTESAGGPEADLDPDATDDVEEEYEEELAPRAKPEIPGADLIPDIVPEGEQFLDAEAQAAAEAEAEAAAAREREESEDQSLPIADAAIDLAAGARYTATGKRKTAVARVILRPGDGAYSINGKPLESFFPRETLQRMIRQPLETVGYESRMDVVARMHGGGVAAQAGALRHGISRALIVADPHLRGELKRRGFLTRDPRVKERKKAGLKKARKRPQFSKR
jgi:small subunit ribosomal protein S9